MSKKMENININIPDDFQDRINLLPALVKGHEEDFRVDAQVIGASSIPYGMRKNVLEKRYEICLETNNGMLSGKIIHKGWQAKEVVKLITKEINEGLGLEETEVNGKRYIKLNNGNYIEFKTEIEKEWYIKVKPNRFLRMHADIWTSLYIVELKTTSMPKNMWGKTLAPYHEMQANLYTGFSHHSIGFLLRIDLGSERVERKHCGALESKGKFGYVWKSYYLLYPYKFNEELFNYSLERVEQYFEYLDHEKDVGKIPCPEHLFECDGCKVKEHCPNPIEKMKLKVFETCSHCGERIKPGMTALIRNNKTYHYTDGNRNRFEECIQACKDMWERESISVDDVKEMMG